MDRRLSQVRQQNPEADLCEHRRRLRPVARRAGRRRDARSVRRASSASHLSKRLIDAQIANIPAGRRASTASSASSPTATFLSQQRITDEEVRMIIRNGLLQQLMIAPAVVNARAPVGMATPYASILLEAREGDVALRSDGGLPRRAEPHPGRHPGASTRRTSAATWFRSSASCGSPGSGRSRSRASSRPTRKSPTITMPTGRTTRRRKRAYITQAVAPDQATANAIVQRLRGGQTFAAAAAPAGFTAQDIAVGSADREQFTTVADARKSPAPLSARPRARSSARSSRRTAGTWSRSTGSSAKAARPLAEARAEISAKLAVDKRKAAIEDIVEYGPGRDRRRGQLHRSGGCGASLPSSRLR